MRLRKVKEWMVPLSEYATVNEEDTLHAAVKTLQECQKTGSKKDYMHRAVLVYNRQGKIAGKVGALDVLRALEPKYCQLSHSEQFYKMGLSRFGLSNKFLHSIADQYCLWNESCETLVKNASQIKVKNIMYTPDEGEYVDGEAPVAEAIHQFILGHHQSLLVVKGDEVIGVLKLSDVFKLICDLMVAL